MVQEVLYLIGFVWTDNEGVIHVVKPGEMFGLNQVHLLEVHQFLHGGLREGGPRFRPQQSLYWFCCVGDTFVIWPHTCLSYLSVVLLYYCHQAKAQLQFNKYIYIYIYKLTS
jgi:hypothetical protein